MRAAIWVVTCCLLATGLAAAQGVPSLAGELTLASDPMEGDCCLMGELAVKPGDHIQFMLYQQEDGSGYLLDVTAPDARFYRLSPTGSRTIGPPGKLPMKSPGEASRYTVSRKNRRFRFLYEGQVVCSGWDGTYSKGAAGYWAPDGQVAEDPLVQQMGPAVASDDFVREEDAHHMWTPESGSWKIESLRDDEQADEMEADKSANAFSYLARTIDTPAVATAEEDSWFWTDYRLSVSARTLEDGAMGLVLLAQDSQNYLAFRWSSAWNKGPAGACAQILEVIDGQPKVLAEKPGGCLPDQWYGLRAQVCDGHIACFVDGLPVLAAYSTAFGQGHPGLYAEGNAGTYFDDVRLVDYELLREDFSSISRWEPASGDWSVTDTGEARCPGEGVLTGGRPEWTDYRVDATVSARGTPVGLHLGRDADGSGVLYRVGEGKAQLLRLTAEGEELVSERDVAVPNGKPLELSATLLAGGFFAGYLNGEPVLQELCPGVSAGAIALDVGPGKGARFDSLNVTFIEKRQKAQITREFTQTSEHPEMAEWAGRKAPWVEPAEIKPGATWWTKGDYFGDTSLSFKVRFVGLRDGTVTVSMNSDPEQPTEGLHLVISATKGSKVLSAKLMDGAEELSQADVELTKNSCRVNLARRGSRVLITVDDQPLIAQEI